MRPIDLDEIEFIKTEGNAEFNHGVDCCINTLLKAPTLKVIKAEVLDEIRAEIMEDIDKVQEDLIEEIDQGIDIGLQMALDTVNKYKVEIEDKE